MADKYSTGLYCFLGGLGGLAAGILFAPDSGAGTRDRIRHKVGDGRDLINAKVEKGREYIERQGARLIDQTNEFVERGKRVVNEQKEIGHQRGGGGKTAYGVRAGVPGTPAGD